MQKGTCRFGMGAFVSGRGNFGLERELLRSLLNSGGYSPPVPTSLPGFGNLEQSRKV